MLTRPALLRLSLALLTLLLAASAGAAPLPALTARYALSAHGLTVARAELQSRPTPAGYELMARVEGGGLTGLFGELGRADLSAAAVPGRPDSRPLSFIVHSKPPFTSATTLLYDWPAGRLHARYDEKSTELALAADLIDPLAFFAQLLEARRAGRPAPSQLRVPYAYGIVEYRLDSLGRETVSTALGARDTEKYELSRPDGGSGRVRITLWLSPADDWLPVLAVRSRKHKERARAEIEAVSRP